MTGGCNKLSVHDWLSDVVLPEDRAAYPFVEVSFKEGARKDFFRNADDIHLVPGDRVAVEANVGHDIGRVALTGELVRLQMKKKGMSPETVRVKRIYRLATDKDLKEWRQARAEEPDILREARAIARQEQMEMKLGDVEFQGDRRKLTFFFTAKERVDFRRLVRIYAKTFQAKIEMRQIGARQEAARLGAIGDCGRETCCSTWLTSFKTVSTNAARYQHLAINTDRLAGQCGRLKCCLNYELDTYLEALDEFPKDAETLKTTAGAAHLVKTDILKRLMFYTYPKSAVHYALPVKAVREILEMNRAGRQPEDLTPYDTGMARAQAKGAERSPANGNDLGGISLKKLEKSAQRKKHRHKRRGWRKGGNKQ